MKKALGIILIIIGFCITVVVKIGPSKETSWVFTYGIWPPLITALIILFIGMRLYRINN